MLSSLESSEIVKLKNKIPSPPSSQTEAGPSADVSPPRLDELKGVAESCGSGAEMITEHTGKGMYYTILYTIQVTSSL